MAACIVLFCLERWPLSPGDRASLIRAPFSNGLVLFWPQVTNPLITPVLLAGVLETAGEPGSTGHHGPW